MALKNRRAIRIMNNKFRSIQLILEAICENTVLTCGPIKVSAARTNNAINAIIKAYSTIDCPSPDRCQTIDLTSFHSKLED
jgi:hypothetical protein